jgi:hypothetical protein
MATYTVNGLGAFARIFAQHQADRERRIRNAVKKAAHAGVPIVKRAVPVAFGELRETVHAEDTKIVVDAPHAAPVEVGSRPHMPPLAPILRWIRLRGMQGLLSRRERGRLPGTTTRAHAESVAAALRGMEQNGALDISATVRLARAIQMAIAKHGTKPHWYARSSLPAIRAALDAFIREALHK